ncbi:MAG: ferritin family protein [Candidatus Thermoplasmatota archaeon]|nr:ferritin family protein [Candidatus Thermoplasmatota archaeon]
MPSVNEILATAVEFERFGSEYYTRMMELVGDQKAKLLMKSLSGDEREHAAILEKELKKRGGAVKPASKEQVRKGLKEIFPERIRKNSIATKDAIEALKLGIRTEQRSIMFYSKNANTKEKSLNQVFKRLEKMELGHLALLEENLLYLQDDGVWYGYLPLLD